MCARTCACARARVAVVRERSRGEEGGGRSLSSPPVRGPVSGSAAGGSRRTAALFPALALLRPLPLLASPHRERPAGVSPLSRPALPCSVPFRFWGVVRVRFPPSGERGAAPRRRPAALSPWLPGARRRTEPASCEGRADGRVVAAAVSPSRVFRPRPLSGYLATAFRRVGLKIPGGVASPSPGSGGRRGPSGAVDVRRLPRTPVPRAAGGRSRGAPPRSGFGSPLSGARGARLRAPGSPVRRRSRAPCLSVPTRSPSVVFLSSSRWPARGEPLSVPPPPLRGRRVERGPCRRQLSSERKTLVRLLAVDHSARASMKNAASCEN